MRTIKIVLSLARAAMRLSATTRKAAAVLALAMFSGLAINATDYYLVGTMNDWTNQQAGYKLTQNPDNNKEYYIDVTLSANAEFKVQDNNGYWYPADGSNKKVSKAGFYRIYFNKDGQGDQSWHYGYIYVKDLNFYLVGSMNSSWDVFDEKYRLTLGDNGEFYLFNVNLSEGVEFKVRSKISEIDGGYYGSKNYVVGETGSYSVYFRPEGNSAWTDYGSFFVQYMTVHLRVAVEGYGYATYYVSNYDVELPNKDIKAYIVTDVNGTTLTYNLIADNDNTTEQPNTVPAGTAILLMVAATDITDKKVDLTLKPKGTDNRTITGNKLYGSDSETTTSGDNYYYYKLTYSDNNDNFGWYWGATGGAAFTSPAHKAWLALPTLPTLPSGTRAFLSLPGDDFTGIATIENRQQNADNVWYDLNGRRINAPTTKGIYVKDGRKFVIK
jgi:hypothetical protein